MTNRVYARITICLLVAVAVLALAPTVSFANSNSVLPPIPPPYGTTYSDWSVLWWQWFLPLTTAEVNACTTAQASHNVVFLLNGPFMCPTLTPTLTVKAGTSLFFPVANVECSDLEGDPFHGDTADHRNTCAFDFFFNFGTPFPLSSGTVTLDGELLGNYPTNSPDFKFVVRPNTTTSFNIKCGSRPCMGHSTGYGYYVMLAPLPSGTHIIRILATDYGINTTWNITVQ